MHLRHPVIWKHFKFEISSYIVNFLANEMNIHRRFLERHSRVELYLSNFIQNDEGWGHQMNFHRTKMNVHWEYWFCISGQEPEDDHTHERSLFKSFPNQFMYGIPHDFLTKISCKKMHMHLEYWFCILSEESEDGHTHVRSRFTSFPKKNLYEIPHDFLMKISGDKMNIDLEYWFGISCEPPEDGHSYGERCQSK